jgi:heme-degrading monooxygenase HmoA
MIVLLFSTTPRSESVRQEYDEMNERTRKIAEETPGFVSWKEYTGPDGEMIGVLEFDSPDALGLWRDHPEHAEVNRRGREAVYGSYRVRVCDVLRESSFTWDGS